MMKAIYYAPLGLALAGLALWSFSQRQASAELSVRSQKLQEKITAVQQLGSTSPLPKQLTRKMKNAVPLRDWKTLATRLLAAQRADTTLEGYHERLAQMTADDLLAALDEISTLGLQPDAQAILEEILVEALIPQDPAQALLRFADRIQDESDGVGWQMAGALSEWAKRDLSAATAWFDQEITAGRFESKSLDGHSEARLEFEAALLGQLLPAVPKAAAARLAALPEDQRRTALVQMNTADMQLTGLQAYMNLIRELVPQAERADALSYLISQMTPSGHHPQVTEFLDTIQATPAERATATKAAAGNQLEEIASERAVTGSDLETIRTWLTQQAPTAVDRLTGEALAQAVQNGGELSFAQAAALISDFHQSSGNDDVITGFLTSAVGDGTRQEATALAGKIKDSKRREEALAHLK